MKRLLKILSSLRAIYSWRGNPLVGGIPIQWGGLLQRGYKLRNDVSLKFGLIFLLILFSISCKEEIPERPVENPTVISKGVFITNEGTFQWGNASITYYNFADSSHNFTDLYENKNGKPLGDVCQSMYMHLGKAYLVMNNSSKIEVVDANSFVSTGTITGLVSPRYFLPVSATKAYVTDLYANSVQVVDLEQLKVIKNIPLRGWTEELTEHNGKVYVTNLRTNYLYRINPQTDVLEDSLWLGLPSGSLTTDKNQKLWVLCSQVLVPGAPSQLCRLSVDGTSVEKTISLGTGAGKIVRCNPSGDFLYWIKSHVYRMSITATTAPASPFISKTGNQNFYSLGIEPINGDVFVSDAADYVQKGKVRCYTSTGIFKNEFETGISPGNFWFN